jgi:hypothetical protein
MAREDWRDRDAREDEARRLDRWRDRDDFGQADYSDDYAYDPEGRRGYRAERNRRSDVYDFGQADYSQDYVYDEAARRAYRRQGDEPIHGRPHEPRTWTDRAGDFFGGRRRTDTYAPRPRRPSDRVLWEVIVERLQADRRLDLSDVEVLVEDREVTLNGRVRSKGEKRRIEDIADLDGVRHVQNNLRTRDHAHWTFL